MKKAKKIMMTILCVLIIIMCANNLIVSRLAFDPINVATDAFGLAASIFALISIYSTKFTSHPLFKICLLILIIAVAAISALYAYFKNNPLMWVLSVLFLAVGFRLIVIMKNIKNSQQINNK